MAALIHRLHTLARKRLAASSLVEVSVATVLLVIATSAALLIYLQVIHSGNSLRQTRWELWLQDYALQIKQTQAYENRTLELTEGRLEKQISLYKDNPQLVMLELVFYPLESGQSPATPSFFGFSTGTQTTTANRYVYREIIYHPTAASRP